MSDPRVVISGRDPVRDLSALVERRLIEAGMKGQRRSRLVAAHGCSARLDDLVRFLSGSLDLDKLLGLARAFMAIKWDQWTRDHCPRSTRINRDQPEETWLAIRMACLPWRLTHDKDIPADPRIVRLLASGDAFPRRSDRPHATSVGRYPPAAASWRHGSPHSASLGCSIGFPTQSR